MILLAVYLIDCQESLRRSFELGVQVGVYRHTRDLLSWSKKRRRRLAREDLMGHLCGKTVPRLRVSQSQYTKTPVKSSSTSTLGRFTAAVDTVEADLQLFNDALAVHGTSPRCMPFRLYVLCVLHKCRELVTKHVSLAGKSISKMTCFVGTLTLTRLIKLIISAMTPSMPKFKTITPLEALLHMHDISPSHGF